VANTHDHVVSWYFTTAPSGLPLVFNTYAAPRKLFSNAAPFYSDQQAIRLMMVAQATRHATQQGRLPVAPSTALGQLGDWRAIAGTIYDAFLLSTSTGSLQNSLVEPRLFANGAQPVLGVTPEQPLDQTDKRHHTEEPIGFLPGEGRPTLRRLCLFNVVVACEWWPISSFYQSQFLWAFRHMSDFLFDATDGYMALGTVAIGGPDWMAGADIQLLSSNRLHPRSWVSGMQLEKKYMPIRIGRGFWSKRKRRAIPWDEPEGYRTLVHEWSHYALGLKDHYLEQTNVVLRANLELIAVQKGQPSDTSLTLPTISLPIESIMSTLEGTSELADNTGLGKVNEWVELVTRFPDLDITVPGTPDEGPGYLPLPLPEIRFIDSLNAQTPLEYRFHPPTIDPSLPLTTPLTAPAVNDDHCWVFTLRGPLSNPTNLIAHGVLEARSRTDGFALLGAQQGDLIVLIGNGFETGQNQTQPAHPIVLTNALGTPVNGEFSLGAWTPKTPNPFPITDVFPYGTYDPQTKHYSVQIAIDVDQWNGWIFPLEGITSVTPGYQLAWTTNGSTQIQSINGDKTVIISNLASLDGHLLLSSGGIDPAYLTIASYSIGGGPQSTNPPYTNPIPAGSSEGNALLFFYDEQASVPIEADEVVPLVITTRNYGAPVLGSILVPRSYTFSLASNMPLPDNRAATLVMFIDRDAVGAGELIEMHRYDDSGVPASWKQIEAFQRTDLSLIAAPLYEDANRYTPSSKAPGATAAGLFKTPLKAERFRIFKR
jgi:hypothetical protein